MPMVRCGQCGSENDVPNPGSYRCWSCQAPFAVPSKDTPGGWRSRVAFFALLLFAACATAATATYLAGLWDLTDARSQASAAWQSTRHWIRAQASPLEDPPIFSTDPETNAAPTNWQVTLRTGEACQATSTPADLQLKTEFGVLRIPIQDVFMLVPHAEPSVGLRRQIAVLIDQLNADDAETVRGAVERLVQMGPDAVAQLEQAENERELEIARIATEILARIRDKYDLDTNTVDGDLVVTRFFGIRGELLESPPTLTGSSTEESIAWNEVRFACRQEFATGLAALTPAHAEAPSEVTVDMDEATLTGQLVDTQLEVETPYGSLSVPIESIVAIRRTDDESLALAEQTAYDLLRADDVESQLAAIASLGQAGPAAVFTLQRVANCADSQLQQQALAQLHELVQLGHALIPLPDQLTTPYGDMGGTIQSRSLKVRTRRGDIEQIDVAAIHSIQPSTKARK